MMSKIFSKTIVTSAMNKHECYVCIFTFTSYSHLSIYWGNNSFFSLEQVTVLKYSINAGNIVDVYPSMVYAYINVDIAFIYN